MIYEVTALDAPELALFSHLTEAQLRNRLEPEKGIFIAESPKVIGTALDNGYEPVAFLMERRHITGDAAPLLACCADVPVYTGESALLETLTGFRLSRGVLCAMRRKPLPPLETVLDGASRLKQMWYITLPSILPTISILFILAVAGILGNDYQKILLMYSPRTYSTADVVNTYVYRYGIETAGNHLSYSSSVGLLVNVVSLVFLIIANTVTGRLSETSLF